MQHIEGDQLHELLIGKAYAFRHLLACIAGVGGIVFIVAHAQRLHALGHRFHRLRGGAVMVEHGIEVSLVRLACFFAALDELGGAGCFSQAFRIVLHELGENREGSACDRCFFDIGNGRREELVHFFGDVGLEPFAQRFDCALQGFGQRRTVLLVHRFAFHRALQPEDALQEVGHARDFVEAFFQLTRGRGFRRVASRGRLCGGSGGRLATPFCCCGVGRYVSLRRGAFIPLCGWCIGWGCGIYSRRSGVTRRRVISGRVLARHFRHCGIGAGGDAFHQQLGLVRERGGFLRMEGAIGSPPALDGCGKGEFGSCIGGGGGVHGFLRLLCAVWLDELAKLDASIGLHYLEGSAGDARIIDKRELVN